MFLDSVLYMIFRFYALSYVQVLLTIDDALVMDRSVGIGAVLGPNDSSHVASTCLEDVEDVVER